MVLTGLMTGHDISGTVIVVTMVTRCEHCQQNKRLSLVRNNLANDLQYIDQTYYPNVVHYSSSAEDPLETELLQLGLHDSAEEHDSEEETDRSWAKLTIGDVTPATRRSSRLTGPSTAVDLSGKSLIKLSPSVGFLDNLTKLTLWVALYLCWHPLTLSRFICNRSHNQMMVLPPELGYLKNLRVLNAAFNQLETLPDTIAFLGKLKALNVSNNRITCLPSSIGSLPKLVIVILNDNKLTEIPRELANLSGLISLNVSNNPLKAIPAEIGSLKSLRKLNADGCKFLEEIAYDLRHDPPSLFEICARAAVRAEIPVPAHILTRSRNTLASHKLAPIVAAPILTPQLFATDLLRECFDRQLPSSTDSVARTGVMIMIDLYLFSPVPRTSTWWRIPRPSMSMDCSRRLHFRAPLANVVVLFLACPLSRCRPLFHPKCREQATPVSRHPCRTPTWAPHLSRSTCSNANPVSPLFLSSIAPPPCCHCIHLPSHPLADHAHHRVHRWRDALLTFWRHHNMPVLGDQVATHRYYDIRWTKTI